MCAYSSHIIISYRRVLGLEYLIGAKADSVQQLFAGQLVLLIQPALLYNHGIKFKFLLRPLNNLLLDGVLSDKPEDLDLSLLSDSVGTVLRLQIGLRVPAGL